MPLRELDAAVEAFAAGDLEQPLVVQRRTNEIGDLPGAIEQTIL